MIYIVSGARCTNWQEKCPILGKVPIIKIPILLECGVPLCMQGDTCREIHVQTVVCCSGSATSQMCTISHGSLGLMVRLQGSTGCRVITHLLLPSACLQETVQGVARDRNDQIKCLREEQACVAWLWSMSSSVHQLAVGSQTRSYNYSFRALFEQLMLLDCVIIVKAQHTGAVLMHCHGNGLPQAVFFFQ